MCVKQSGVWRPGGSKILSGPVASGHHCPELLLLLLLLLADPPPLAEARAVAARDVPRQVLVAERRQLAQAQAQAAHVQGARRRQVVTFLGIGLEPRARE